MTKSLQNFYFFYKTSNSTVQHLNSYHAISKEYELTYLKLADVLLRYLDTFGDIPSKVAALGNLANYHGSAWRVPALMARFANIDEKRKQFTEGDLLNQATINQNLRRSKQKTQLSNAQTSLEIRNPVSLLIADQLSLPSKGQTK